jgi:hypothetical protein
MIALLATLSVAAGCAGVPGPVAGDPGPRATVQQWRVQHRPAGAWSRTVVRVKERSAGSVPAPTVPTFEYAYAPPDSPGLQQIHVRVRDADLLRRLPEVQALDGMFVLPRRLRYLTAECGEFGAFYRPAESAVVLCYETLRTLYERGRAQQLQGGLDDGHAFRYVRANIRFIVLHETGHALVHLLDLPVTGRQEDAVDQLAAILMLRFADLDETSDQVMGNLRMAADWLLSRSTGAYNLDAYADEHALGEQRYFNLQCLVYGTDPAAFASIVDAGDLTPARARGCARETRLATRAWLRLLLPHLAPGLEPYEEEAARYLERKG